MSRVIGWAMIVLLFGGAAAQQANEMGLLKVVIVWLSSALILGWVLLAMYLICKEPKDKAEQRTAVLYGKSGKPVAAAAAKAMKRSP